jgi:hypothetical protein
MVPRDARLWKFSERALLGGDLATSLAGRRDVLALLEIVLMRRNDASV